MKLTIEDGRDSFYTFDTNRILLLTATDEEQINQVEFSTEENGETVSWTSDVLTGEDGIKYVQVPNEFLNGNYSRLVCYYVALDSNGEFTRQKEVFRIRARQEPEDYYLTYSERVTFASIKALIEQYKATTKQYMDTTEGFKDNAGRSAELASKYAENNEDVAVEPGKYSAKHWSIKAEAAKETAVQKATEAGTSEVNSKTYMESAQSAKQDAETAKNAANTILEQVQSKGTEITNFVATSKTEIETQKNESVNAVKSVYQTDLDELKGDLVDLYDAILTIGDMTNGKYIDYDDGKMYDGANYSATGFVPVKSGYSVKLDGVALINYASVCGYDSKQKFVKPILTSLTGNVEFDVEDGISYIRATGKANDVVTGKYVNYPISKDFEKANEKIKKNELGNIFQKTIKLTQRTENRYVYYEDATLEYDANSDSFYKIPVARNKDIVIDGIYVVGNRSVIGHKYDGTHIDIIHDSGKTSLKFNSADCDFVSVTVAKGTTPTIEYVDYYTDIKDEFMFDSITNYNESDVNIPYPKTTGYLNEKGVIVAHDSFRVSEFISVRFGEEITIKNFFAMAYCLCHFFDEDKNLIKSIPYDNTYVTVSSATVRVPYNVKYVRYSLSVAQLSTTGIEYAEKTLKNSVTNGFINRFINKMNAEIAIPFAKATDKPIITIVDDDTTNTRAVELFYNKLNNLGIVGTYACLTRQFTTDTNVCAKLKEYERKGFQTVIHGYIQGDFYNTTEDRNIALCMDDLVHGMEDLNANNFLDYKYWVTPFGVNDDPIVKLAKKLGLKCIVNIGSSSINSDDGTFDRYHIQRYGLNEGCNVEEVKSLVDKCVSQNGWLLLGTHSAQWSTDFVEFDEIINYALVQGCEIMTLGDALRKREPIYRYYEMF